MRQEVEHPVRVGPEAGAEEHVADLGHRRVGDHPLDVDLDERDQTGQQQRSGAEARRHVLHLRRRLEDHVRAHDQVDARGDHRGGVDQRADGRRALHRIRQPRVERQLRGLRHGAAEQAERDEVDDPRAVGGTECLI